MNEQKQKQQSESWFTEGKRKLIMVSLALLVFGAVVISWMFAQPEGVEISDLVTWVGGVISALATLGVGGNVAEHMIKSPGTGGISGQSLNAFSTLDKIGIVFLVGGVLLFTGCASSTPYLPLLGSSLQTSQVAADLAKVKAKASASLPGCYASSTLSAALATSADAIESWTKLDAKEAASIPGVLVDVGDCIGLDPSGAPWALEDAATAVEDFEQRFAPAAFMVARAILGSSGLECRDLVIVGGVLGYLEGALGPVVEELVEPDGVLEVPMVAVNLTGCG